MARGRLLSLLQRKKFQQNLWGVNNISPLPKDHFSRSRFILIANRKIQRKNHATFINGHKLIQKQGEAL